MSLGVLSEVTPRWHEVPRRWRPAAAARGAASAEEDARALLAAATPLPLRWGFKAESKGGVGRRIPPRTPSKAAHLLRSCPRKSSWSPDPGLGITAGRDSGTAGGRPPRSARYRRLRMDEPSTLTASGRRDSDLPRRRGSGLVTVYVGRNRCGHIRRRPACPAGRGPTPGDAG